MREGRMEEGKDGGRLRLTRGPPCPQCTRAATNGQLGRKAGRREEGEEGRPKLTCSWRFCDLAAFSPSPWDPERRLPPWL